jgi:hypothetical protein
MKKCFVSVIFLLALGAAFLWPAHAQDQQAQFLAVINGLKQQQAVIADNQTKLDQKIADVGETIRVARLFMSRAGGKHKPPPSTKPGNNPPPNNPPATSNPPGSR